MLVILVAGDVVVGWVNARTGKGEIDDYFLAGDQLKCDDGAESCPDTSKPVTYFFCSLQWCYVITSRSKYAWILMVGDSG